MGGKVSGSKQEFCIESSATESCVISNEKTTVCISSDREIFNTKEINTVACIGPSSGEIREQLDQFVPLNGQTIFTLSKIPTSPDESRLFINGQKLKFVRDYVIAGSQLTYLNSLYILNTNDDLEIYYFY